MYTDGACEGNGKAGAKAGIGVYWGPDHPWNVSEPVRGRLYFLTEALFIILFRGAIFDFALGESVSVV